MRLAFDSQSTSILTNILREHKTIENFVAENADSVDAILIIHTNIVSLQKNYNSLMQFLNQFKTKFDVICLSETRFSNRNLNRCSLSDCCLFYCNSKTKTRGSSIYVSDDIDCQQPDNVKINVDGCENVWVKLNFNRKELLIVGEYMDIPLLKLSSLKMPSLM